MTAVFRVPAEAVNDGLGLHGNGSDQRGEPPRQHPYPGVRIVQRRRGGGRVRGVGVVGDGLGTGSRSTRRAATTARLS